MQILVFNAGSSSLKASVIETDRWATLAATMVAWGSDATRVSGRARAVEQALDALRSDGLPSAAYDAVGHRFVHGGASFRAATFVDDAVLGELGRLVHMAPLHNGVALDTIVTARGLLGDVPHVCAFDTAFHAGLPPEGHVYPLPWRWYEDWGIRRYGFHGLSVAWSVRRAGELLEREPAGLRLVVAHLGSGCSVTAVTGGQSVATSMGLTPLEGLMMGTRSGSVDPGILLALLRERRLTLEELADAIAHEAGLLGVSGISGDVRAVSEAAESGNRRARLALAMFVRRAVESIAAAATALPSLDALVFTGGIGENAGELRARIVGRLTVLGLDSISPSDRGTDGVLSDADARIAVLRVKAREDLVIGAEVAAVVERGDLHQRAVQPPST